MKKLFLIFLILALESFFIYSQDNAGALNVPWPDRQVWPESPRAAQLRQVMMPTPGLLTGAVEFEIPIYTIEAEGVSIPISLKYRSNGIKVDDITISHDGNRAVTVDNYGDGAKFEDMVGSPGLSGMTLTYDDAGRLRSDETRGIVRIDYNNDGLPTRVYFSDGHSQLDSYDGFGNRLSTSYYEAITPVVVGKIPSRSRLVSTRYYYGDGTVCEGDSVVMTRFNGGYFDGNGKPYYELADYQGNITTVLNRAGEIVSHTGFYPYGQPWRRPGERQWLYGGKEWLGADGRDEYDFHARRQYPHLGIFTTPDPLAEATHCISPYAYCGGNPIRYSDPTGMVFSERSWMMIQLFMEKCKYDRVNEIEDGIKSFKAFIETGVGIVDAIKHFNKANEYKAVLDEIEELNNSDTMYDITLDSSKRDNYGNIVGTTTYNTEINRVEITVPNFDCDILAHELKHAHQFETGTMSLNGSLLYDQGDEKEAYYRSALFGGPKWEEVKQYYEHLRPNRVNVKSKDKKIVDIINGNSFPEFSIFKYNNKIYRPL